MIYTCPMHPEIKQDHPGKCPKCGGMDLIPQHGTHATHETHDHSAMMAGPQVASDFLRRFLIVTLLLVPLLITSKLGIRFLGLPDFAGRTYIEFSVATAIFYFGLIFFQHARHEWMAKKYGMMTLVSLAVGSGFLFSAASTFIPAVKTEFYLEISTLIWVLLFGHFLEAKSSSAAGDALKEVAKLLPKQAHRIGTRAKGQGLRDEKIEDVDIEKLKEGDVVLVKPGEKVPADGVIARGYANFNEAHLTGESRPLSKKVGDRAVAGAICLDGSVEITLDKVGENSTIGQIKQLIQTAQTTKPTAQKIADKAASILTFTALGVGMTSLLFWSLVAGQPFVFGMTLAITVLVIACPHALGLAIPTVSTIATTLAVKNGVFLKDLAKLEVIKKATYVILDKTGTLTTGEFGVTKIVSTINHQPSTINHILHVAASLEAHSSHVIGLSIVKYAKQKGASLRPVANFKNLAGKGVEGTIGKVKYAVGNFRLMEEKKLLTNELKETYRRLADAGNTMVFVADDKQVLGIISLSDQIKPESILAVKNLHRLGVKAAMVTGDNHQVADGVGKELGIDTVFAEVLPADKYKYVRELQDKGEIVVMVGDGVNDAPALKQANAGVAIGAGTDVAVEAGDVVLTRSNPEDVAKLVILSRKVYRKMVENLLWATGYNVLAIPAAAGLFIPWGFRLTPGVGAILMSLSSVIVVLNALSLRRLKL